MLFSANYLAYVMIDQIKAEWRDYFRDENNPDIFEHYRWPLLFGLCAIVAFGVT